MTVLVKTSKTKPKPLYASVWKDNDLSPCCSDVRVQDIGEDAEDRRWFMCPGCGYEFYSA